MSKKIFILTIAGMGTKKPGYSNKLVQDVLRYAEGSPLENNFKVLECFPYNDTGIDRNQDDMFDRIESENNLGGILSLRKFVLENIGDAMTFEHSSSNPESPYQKIHRYLREKIEEVNQIMAGCDDAKLVIVGASLGIQVLMTYIWDADNDKGIFEQEPATNNNNLKNLSYLATFGCSIPLFLSGYSEDQIIAIEKRNEEFTWDNYYDKDDVVGWPLHKLSPSYNNLVNDHEINCGSYVGSHVRYWKDKDFTKPFTQKLIALYETM